MAIMVALFQFSISMCLCWLLSFEVLVCNLVNFGIVQKTMTVTVATCMNSNVLHLLTVNAYAIVLYVRDCNPIRVYMYRR